MRRYQILSLLACLAMLSIGRGLRAEEPPKTADDPYAAARNRMVQRHLAERGIKDPRVLEAFRTVPRHKFLAPRSSGRRTRMSRFRLARGRRSRHRMTWRS